MKIVPTNTVRVDSDLKLIGRRRGPLSHFVPEDFEVADKDVEWARAEHPSVNLYLETQKFRDHEFHQPHSDWRRAWRNWIRRAADGRR
jgi:hypothetical protein